MVAPGLDLQADAQKVQVRIADANGAITCAPLKWASRPACTLDWDEKNDSGVVLEPGAYRVRLATDGDGKKINSEVLGAARSRAWRTHRRFVWIWAWTARPACWMCAKVIAESGGHESVPAHKRRLS